MKTAHIIVSVADIYREHTFTSEVVSQGLASENVIIIDTYKNWSKIEQWDGYQGWINNFYLDVTSNSGDKIPKPFIDGAYIEGISDKTFLEPSLLRYEVVNICITFLGVPYKWGGKSPFGFDCSGLVQTAFKINGIFMPRDSREQYEMVKSNKITLDRSEKGDLLFFKEYGKICHVAIYNKDMKFIHSSGMVKENSLQEEDDLFDRKLMNKFIGIFSMSEIIKEQLNERR